MEEESTSQGLAGRRSHWQLAFTLGRQRKGDGERQSCVEGFYFGKAVQKIIQNVAVKRENQTLSVKKIFTSTN